MDTKHGFIPRAIPHQTDLHRVTHPSLAQTPICCTIKQSKMMTLAALMFVPVALAATLKDHQPLSNAGVDMDSSITQAATITNSSGTCGVGYTYCGYILKEQKSTSHNLFSLSPTIDLQIADP